MSRFLKGFTKFFDTIPEVMEDFGHFVAFVLTGFAAALSIYLVGKGISKLFGKLFGEGDSEL